ncbi:MAG: sugar kinase [Cytophagaceae bacterium]|jgi:2-dehydro-3-deoxygluconokinase|nr:sugar kinase [Cytophagaceae bacterium]
MLLGVGEIMMRLSPPGNTRVQQARSMDIQYGGSESNVMSLLAQWNHSVSFFTALPNAPLGMSAKASLQVFSVDTSRIVFSEGRLGIYFLEKGAGNRPSQVWYDRQDSCMSKISLSDLDFESLLASVTHLHWSGITPAISASAAAFMQELLKQASAKNILISADLNFRSNLWKYGKSPSEVMPALLQHCHILVGGAAESQSMLGIQVPLPSADAQMNEEILMMREVFSHWKEAFSNLRWIASTMRRSPSASHNSIGACLWTKAGFYTTEEWQIPAIVDRVGSGDAFMAGFLHGILRFPDQPQRILDWALASAAYKHSMEGDVCIATLEEIERSMQTGKSVRIIR